MQIIVRFCFLCAVTGLYAQTPVLVKDINPGPFSGIFYPPANAAVAGNTLYFNSVGNSLDAELWKSDGTEAGTVLVKDINPGSQGSQQKFYAVYKDQLYFTAFAPDLGTELWRTDDLDGAVLAAGDACPGSCDGAFNGTQERLFIEYNDKLFFRLRNELWSSEDTAEGTRMLKDINPNGGNGMGTPVAGPDAFYFWARASNGEGNELWRSDGTQMVR